MSISPSLIIDRPKPTPSSHPSQCWSKEGSAHERTLKRSEVSCWRGAGRGRLSAQPPPGENSPKITTVISPSRLVACLCVHLQQLWGQQEWQWQYLRSAEMKRTNVSPCLCTGRKISGATRAYFWPTMLDLCAAVERSHAPTARTHSRSTRIQIYERWGGEVVCSTMNKTCNKPVLNLIK